MYKLNKDGFVWEVISHDQVSIRAIYQEVFILNDDDTESLLDQFDNLDTTKVYGVEVGYVEDIESRTILTTLIVQFSIDEYESKYDVFPLVAMDTYELINLVRQIIRP